MSLEEMQRGIAERMGVTWEQYKARGAPGGEKVGVPWPEGFASLRFRWRPDRVPWAPNPDACGHRELAAEQDALDRAHNQAVLDRIPKTEQVQPDDPLAAMARAYGHVGMAVKFMGQRAIETFGMRGYRPIFDQEGQWVRAKTLYMVEIDERIAQRRLDQHGEAEAYRAAGPSRVEGDICRLTWHVWLWRGVLALYEYYDHPGDYLVTREEQFAPERPSRGWLRGIEMQTQFTWRRPKLRRWRFYRRLCA